MKIKVKLSYPISSLCEHIEEIDIPDDTEDVDDWLYEHGDEILKNDGADEDAVVYAREFLTDMGITILKE